MGVRTTNNSMSFTSSSARTFARTMLFLTVFATALVLVLPAGAKIAWAEEFGGDVPNYDEQPADTWSWMSSDGKSAAGKQTSTSY